MAFLGDFGKVFGLGGATTADVWRRCRLDAYRLWMKNSSGPAGAITGAQVGRSLGGASW